MAHISDLIGQDIQAYLHQHEHKSLLRFITCGSVDDGKSTLIGRLLYDSKSIFTDQLEAIERTSASRASPSTSRTGSSPPSTASSSWPTRPGTSSTRATWSPARRPPTSR